ncbi:PIG-L deacetylase family protein [Paenibacillus sp. strain BS8-2]
MNIWIGIAAVLVLAGVVLISVLNRYINDYRISTRRGAFKIGDHHAVLAVFAHPDDEVMACGTLAKLKRYGSRIHALYLTQGEDGPTGGLAERHELAGMRRRELDEVARILHYDSMEVLHYPDRRLQEVDEQILEDEIERRIIANRPDTVLCFDSSIGLYGHLDHVCAGRAAQNLIMNKQLGVKHLLVMTLPDSMIELAMKLSKTFRERYDRDAGMPPANYAVNIASYGKQKKAVVRAHRTQHQVMGDVQPLYDKLPYWLYYRIFSREYFHYVSLPDANFRPL